MSAFRNLLFYTTLFTTALARYDPNPIACSSCPMGSGKSGNLWFPAQDGQTFCNNGFIRCTSSPQDVRVAQPAIGPNGPALGTCHILVVQNNATTTDYDLNIWFSDNNYAIFGEVGDFVLPVGVDYPITTALSATDPVIVKGATNSNILNFNFSYKGSSWTSLTNTLTHGAQGNGPTYISTHFPC